MSPAARLAAAGVRFREIAGNDGLILITVLTSPEWVAVSGVPYSVLFTQPILTQLTLQRVALVVPVPDLAMALVQLEPSVSVIEHIYDY